MGWSLGYDPNWRRDVGYGVPAVCDHPRCDEVIDRGLSHVCGGEPFGGERCCGLFFCPKHFRTSNEGRQVCTRCYHRKPAYKAKPDTREWIEWKLTDPSWAEWRASEPKQVAAMQAAITTPDAIRAGADRTRPGGGTAGAVGGGEAR